MSKKIIFQVACFSILFVTSVFANPDGASIRTGDLRISEMGSGLVFPDGSIQYKAADQGPAGTNGLNSLTLLVDEGPGTNCTNGGVKIQAGLDLNRDGVLNANEITQSTQTKYICNGGAASSTPGAVTGTVTYTGSLATVSASKPIVVLLNPFPNTFDGFVENGTTYQMATFSASPGTFTFTNVPPGQYHLVAIFEQTSGIVSANDPVEIYTPGSATGTNYHADPTTAFTVTAGQVYSTSPNISFNDSMRIGQ